MVLQHAKGWPRRARAHWRRAGLRAGGGGPAWLPAAAWQPRHGSALQAAAGNRAMLLQQVWVNLHPSEVLPLSGSCAAPARSHTSCAHDGAAAAYVQPVPRRSRRAEAAQEPRAAVQGVLLRRVRGRGARDHHQLRPVQARRARGGGGLGRQGLHRAGAHPHHPERALRVGGCAAGGGCMVASRLQPGCRQAAGSSAGVAGHGAHTHAACPHAAGPVCGGQAHSLHACCMPQPLPASHAQPAATTCSHPPPVHAQHHSALSGRK